MGNSLLAIEPRSKAISEDAIRDQLSRILESSMFVQSERLGQMNRGYVPDFGIVSMYP